MKLIVLEIDIEGTPTKLTDLDRGWTTDELGGNIDFQIIPDLDPIPSNYADISSIENWHKYGVSLVGKLTGFLDWKCLRNEIKLIADSITSNDLGTNWSQLNTAEQKLTCQYIANKVPSANFISTYPDEVERRMVGLEFDKNSSSARTQRYLLMRGYLLSKIGGENSLLFFEDVIRDSRIEAYLGGIESKSVDNISGLEDIIKGTDIYVSGSTPEGLIHRAYPVTDGSSDTLSDVCDNLISIMYGSY